MEKVVREGRVLSFHRENLDETNIFWTSHSSIMMKRPYHPVPNILWFCNSFRIQTDQNNWITKTELWKALKCDAKDVYYKSTPYTYLKHIRLTLREFAFVIFPLRCPFSKCKCMTIRFQKDTQLFKEGGTFAKSCVSSTSETDTAFHFKRLFGGS